MMCHVEVSRISSSTIPISTGSNIASFTTMYLSTFVASLFLLGPVQSRSLAKNAAKCAVAFEGRIPKSKPLSDFDNADTSPFGPNLSIPTGMYIAVIEMKSQTFL